MTGIGRRAAATAILAVATLLPAASTVAADPTPAQHPASTNTTAPDTPPAIPAMKKVTSGLRHSCGLTTAGAVWCWGTNVSGILGNPSVEGAWYPLAVDVASTPLEGKTVSDIEASTWTTCATTSDGDVSCWGANRSGANGDGTLEVATKPRAVATAGTPLAGKDVATVALDGSKSCAITTDGTLACWGSNANGFLGAGDTSVHRTPTAIATAGTVLEGKAIAEVAVTANTSCAVTTDGIIACWGDGQYGLLGTGNETDSLTPVPVATAGTVLAGKQIIDVAMDVNRACALTADSIVACWGVNRGSTPVEEPTTGTPLAGKQIVELTRNGVTCARTSTGVVACLGSNNYSQLGTSSSSTTWVSPTTGGTALAGQTVVDLSPGSHHVCAATATGVIACWGANEYGQVGRSSSSESYLATAITYGAPSAPQIATATGSSHQITVTWKPPASTGGYPITGYRVTASRMVFDLTIHTVGAEARTDTFTAVLNGASYIVSVQALNAKGTSESGSTTVTPPAPTSTVAPFATWSAFTDQQFHDIEGRAPTADEVSTWTTQLTSAPSAKGMLVEGLRRGADNTTKLDPTVRLYRAFLGRAPDRGGLVFWVNRRRAGGWTLVRMADQFARSTEFLRKYGALTNRQFVERIYTDVLAREADPTGVDYWTGRLDAKARSRGSVMVGFSESSEYQRKQAENTDLAVATIFLLGRAPSTTDASDWLRLRNSGLSHADLLRDLLDGTEYAARIDG